VRSKRRRTLPLQSAVSKGARADSVGSGGIAVNRCGGVSDTDAEDMAQRHPILEVSDGGLCGWTLMRLWLALNASLGHGRQIVRWGPYQGPIKAVGPPRHSPRWA
jgi:hypothetical protein